MLTSVRALTTLRCRPRHHCIFCCSSILSSLLSHRLITSTLHRRGTMIRLRHPNGTTTMPVVEGETSLGDFVRFVEEKVGGNSGNGPHGFQWSGESAGSCQRVRRLKALRCAYLSLHCSCLALDSQDGLSTPNHLAPRSPARHSPGQAAAQYPKGRASAACACQPRY